MVEKSTPSKGIASRKGVKFDPLSVYEFTDDDLSLEISSDSVDSKLNSTPKSAGKISTGRRTRSQTTHGRAGVGTDTESNAKKSPRAKGSVRGELAGKQKDVNAAGKNKGKSVEVDEVIRTKKREVVDGQNEQGPSSSSNLKTWDFYIPPNKHFHTRLKFKNVSPTEFEQLHLDLPESSGNPNDKEVASRDLPEVHPSDDDFSTPPKKSKTQPKTKSDPPVNNLERSA